MPELQSAPIVHDVRVPHSATAVSVRAEAEAFAGVRRVTAAMQRAGYGGDDVFAMRLALEEALANACYHGNLEVGSARGTADREAHEDLARRRRWEAPYRDRRLRVSVAVSRAEAVFVVRDDGPGFDVSQLPAADRFDAERSTGRGVMLMRTIMDEVKYNAAGNEVSLVKRRAPDPPPAGEGADDGREKPG